jgi:hypothetical protein
VKISDEQFERFVAKTTELLGRLGLVDCRLLFRRTPPVGVDESNEAGFIYVPEARQVTFYMGEPPYELNDDDIDYLAWHESLELLLHSRFKTFAGKCADRGAIDYDEWEGLAHDAIHRLMAVSVPGLSVRKNLKLETGATL